MRTNYVLIDYENVQPEDLTLLNGESFKVLVFVGANQTKIAFDLVASMQNLAARAEYIKIAGSGSNALDFHIAFYVGHLAALDQTGYFHIISKDTGFDPLIQHLKSKKVAVARSKSVPEIPLFKAANSKSIPEKIAVVVANLRQRGASRPRTVKTLFSTIGSLFQKQLGEQDLEMLLTELKSKGYVTVNENKVTYALPECDA